MQGTISRRLWAKAGEERIPLTGAFELLPICNFACKMCYVRKSRAEVEKAGGLMDGKRWLEIAEDAAKCGLLFPLLTGGEPFLYEDFQEVFAGMQDLGMQVSINSNASRIDQNMARWLGRHTPTRINITLYGASEETYQKLCGNGESFLKVKNAVRWLKQYGVPIKLNASITPQNVQDLESMISYAKECQIPIQAATYMFPPILLAIPYFILVSNLGLANTLPGLLMAYMSFTVPFCTYLLVSYFRTVPKDIEEAAMIDGLRRPGVFLHIALPLVAPGLVATAIFAFINAWNEFLYSLLIISSGDKQTVSVGLYSLKGGMETLQWGDMMAASVLVVIPSIVFFSIIQKSIVGGLTAGADK